ncbi:MAG: MBL fold metallo-hydrolase [Planctomycetes bacterium]|nr:MBL fold metallo-hydrolase [Planctomycetota bacterium]
MDFQVRIATAIVLARSSASGREFFLVERAPQLRFFGGYHAFPGGVLDREERAEYEAARGAGDAARAARALEDCAVRELFEETGVCACPDAARLTPAGRESLRAALLAGDQGEWRRLRGGAGTRPPLASLCTLLTPPFAPVRYETTFFLLELPPGAVPEVRRGELVGGEFTPPAPAIARWRAGTLSIAPPVLFLLELAAAAGELQEFQTRVREECAHFERGRLHPVRFVPGIFTAPLAARTRPPAETTNCHLAGVERLYIVDPAPVEAREIERLCERIDAARAAGARLEGILITHHHADHVGALSALSARYGLAVSAHAETLARLPEVPPRARELRDGDLLDLGRAPDGTAGWRLHALATPGHAPGHLAFVESRYRTAIAGDLVSTLSTVVIDPDDGGHLATYIASLQKLHSFGIGALLPGHGPAVRDGAAKLREYLAHRARREQRLAQNLALAPRSVEELLATVYDDVDGALRRLAAKSLLAGLIKLEEEGRAVRRGDRWCAAH